MRYKIVTDEEKLKSFIDMLPNIEKNECFYLSLLVRNKYFKSFKHNGQIKSFTANKHDMFNKIKQLEISLGDYTLNGESVPQECLSLYINPNPRCFIKASRFLVKELTDLYFKEYNGYNPHKLSMVAIQKAQSRCVYMHYDFDHTTVEEMKPLISNVINEDCLIYVETHGGFHLLVDVNKIETKYIKNYYNSIKNLPHCDLSGDGLLPMVGTNQYCFTPNIK